MPEPGFSRSTSLGSLAAAAIVLMGCFVNICFAAALVGETRYAKVSPDIAVSIDAMKAGYRRPALIPFPKENPYTPEKASLGKKAVFRYASFGDIGAVLRELS
jgi:cytochrome c peroxidase